jgi:hypothetical protein
MAAGDIGMDQPGFFHGEYGRMVFCHCLDSKIGKALEKLIAAGWHDSGSSPETRRLSLLLHLRRAWAIRRATSPVFSGFVYAQRA